MKLPQVGDQVVYHPRPSDRVRKPDGFGGLVSHVATVAHVHPTNYYNLGVLDSGGVPYNVTNIPFLVPGEPIPEYGGWCEWWQDKEDFQSKDPFIKDPKK